MLFQKSYDKLIAGSVRLVAYSEYFSDDDIDRRLSSIVNSKLVKGIGGGICQVSTTLYNAAVRANMEITERNHHSLPVHYVSTGMDATVDFGNLDLKFRNNSKYPVYIEAVTTGGKIVINLYSHK